MSGARALATLATGAVCVLALCSCGGTGSATTVVPDDFLGINSLDVFKHPNVLAQKDLLKTERRAGAELIRVTFAWSRIEPRPGVYDWAPFDAFMKAAAEARVRVLAVLAEAPTWAEVAPIPGITPSTQYPPQSMAQYAAFAASVARRYGPAGTFWRANPAIRALPIRSWQIWNEPNFKIYWGWHPDVARYVAMLRAAYRAIRAIDRHAEIVTAGPANTNFQNGIPLPTFLHGLLAARPPFSTLAIDVYTAAPAGLLLTIEQVRAALAAVGRSATPIWLTEFGWASGGPPSGFTVGASLQARYVFYTIVTLAEDASTLGIRGIVYFDWQDGSPYLGRSNFWGLHTGLVALNGQKKPALSKYYQAAGVVTGLP